MYRWEHTLFRFLLLQILKWVIVSLFIVREQRVGYPCFLTEEKIRMCGIVTDSGADYIKTSTGFGGSGATREDVALFAQHIGPHVKIKAAGGIADLHDAQAFIELGASRLGTSRIVKAVKAMEE